MHFDSQLDYGRRSRRGLWGWLRQRELRAVRAVWPPLHGLRIWEACAGAGYYTEWMVAEGAREVVAVDRSATMLAQIPSGPIRSLCMDVGDFCETGFDLTACLGGLEFLPCAASFFAQAAASGSGQLLLLTPRRNLGGQLYKFYHACKGNRVFLRSAEELDRAGAACGWQRRARRLASPYSEAWAYQR